MLLKSLREASGLSQEELAEKVGVSRSYISQLENSRKYKKEVSISVIIKLSYAFGICPFYLFSHFAHIPNCCPKCKYCRHYLTKNKK